MKRYTDKKRVEVDNYRVGELVMLSTKDLKYQMVRRRTEKLTERFVGPYKIKKIVSSNAVELELPKTVKIHLVVNVSRIHRYVEQVEGITNGYLLICDWLIGYSKSSKKRSLDKQQRCC